MQTTTTTATFTTLADRLAEVDGGFTVDPATGEEPSTGFAVAIFPEVSRVAPAATVTPEDIADFAATVSTLRSADERVRIGGWHDPETHLAYLDASAVVPTLGEAVTVARENDQLAVFDLSAGSSIRVA